MAQAIESGVEELAAFRLVPCTLPEGCEHNSAEAPIAFWWDALAPFLKQASSVRVGVKISWSQS